MKLSALVLIVASVAACGGSSGPAGSPKVDPLHGDVCALLTNEDVSSVMQEQVVGSPFRVDGSESRACEWKLSGGAADFVVVTLDPASYYDSWRHSGDPDVAGLGQPAYWTSVNGIWISVDGVTLNIEADGDQVDSETAATALAKVALSRL